MATSGNNANFNVTIGANMDPSGVLGAVKQMQGAFNGLKLPANMTGDVLKNFNKLTESLSKFEKLASQDHFSKTDVKSLQKLQKEINSTFGELKGSLTDLSGHKFYLEADYTKIKEARQVVDQLKADIQTKLSSIKIDFSSAKGGTASLGLDTLLSRMEQGVKTSKTLNSAMSEMGNSIRAGNLSAASEQFTQIITKAKNLKGASAELLDTFKQWGLIDFSGTAKEISSMEERGRLLSQVFTKLIPIFSQDGEAVGKLSEKLQEATTHTANLEKTGIENYTNSISNGIQKTEELGNVARQTGQATVEMADGMRRASDEIQQLQQSTQYFFSLRNMINLLKRGIREAVDVVKELDAAMTKTAVVTDFSVGDMWEKLPEYTANANALGASVKDMYEATTLYYQQGLDTAAAMGIANETMKMARIGGLEAADATDKMTAALRGFNMELNETSAQRINDVYSNLAAKTASDTEELGTAMQRTASIAASAGMSFEGTAAFLAQAIETTREPAENLGTAMKTIVARFTELKKNPLEIAEVDGEEVDYNKVDAALKSIGVSLKDTNGQFRNLDQVFLDISERWNSLTQTQQRYIATTAAGSRQQSRFIAMMSNYERTMQLMDYANNSTGASSEQFGKTMESLEAKINKLKNAWNEFLMNIMNDSWTKGIVDGTTKVLNTVTTLIDKLSFGQKGIKSVLSLFTAFTALKLTGRGANALIGGLGGLIDPNSSVTQGFRQGILGAKQTANAAQAQMIYQPIVAELRAIRQLKGQEITQQNQARIGAYDQYNKFKDARAFLTGLTRGGKAFSLQDLQQRLSGLDARHQNVLMRGNAGTAYTLTRGILGNYSGGKGYDKNIAAGIKNGERFWNMQRQNGSKTWEEYFNAISDPKLLKQGIDKTIGNGRYNPAYEYLDSLDKDITRQAAEATRNSDVGKAIRDRYDEVIKEANERNLSGKERSDYINKVRQEENWGGRLQEENQKQRRRIIEAQQGSFKNSNAARLLNTIGQVGAGFSQVGMGIQAFGNILTSSANPALQVFGTALTSVGGLISGIGMGISGITTGFTAIASSSVMTAAESALAGTALGGLGLTATTLTGILGILVVAIAGIAVAIKKHNENIRKSAEEVTQNYKDKSSENQSNLANLKQWRSELAILSKGVDENGLNVSLDSSDYSHYLEIVDGIAKINPSIVQGYNAQGHAIIDNNKALEETLALEREREKQILKDYTSNESLSKLLAARNLEGRHQAGGGGGARYVQTIPFELKPRTNMRQEISAIGDELRKNKDYIDLSSLGIDIDLLAAGSEEEFNKVVNQYDAFKGLVLNSINAAGDEWSDASREAIEKSLSAYSEQASELDKIVQPVYEALSAKASQTAGFKQMENSLKAPFQNALKELATTGNFGNDGKAIGEAAKNMATKFASYNDIYLDAMDKVADANDQFAADLNEQEYKANTEEAIASLEKLKASLEDTPEGHAISEWIDNEINKIENHVSGGAKTIEEAWDTISDKVSVAEGALDEFNKATEKDFYTAADGMQKIYETAMDKDAFHSIGLGDNTFWQAAEQLLGTDNIMDKSMNDIRGMMADIEPFLKEGPEGVQNFASKVSSLQKELDGIRGVEMGEDGWFASIDENVNPDAWKEIADILGISEELLTSMVNKARQFKPMDFSDMQAVRDAYSTSDTTIHGTQQVQITRTDKEGKETTVTADKLFISDAELRERMGSSYYQKAERDKKIEALSAQGITVLPEHLKDLDAAIMKNEMGITNMTDAIETFGKTGIYDKEEIRDATEKLLGDNFNEEAFNDNWASYLENTEYPTLAPIQSIEDYVATIANNIANQNIEKGILTNRQSDELEQAIFGKKGVNDTLANYFRLGQDVNGEKLDEYTYNKGLNELLDLQSQGQAYLAALEEGKNKATGEEQARYIEEIERTKAALSSLGDAIEAGKQKWDEYNSTDTPDVDGGSKGVTIPGVGYVESGSTSPYTPEEEELYSRNSRKISEFWNEFWNGSTPTGNTEPTPEQQQKKYGGVGSEGAADAVTESADNLQEVGSQLQEGGAHIESAASKLEGASSKLETAASNFIQTQTGGSNSSNSSVPKGTTIPGVGFVESNPQVSGDINIETANAEAKLTILQTKLAELNKAINEGGTYKLTVTGVRDIKAAASAAKTLTKNSGTKTIGVKTGKADTSSVDKAKVDIGNTQAKIQVGANVDSAIAAARRAQRTIEGMSAKIDVEAHVKKTGINSISIAGKTYYVNTAASGQHNHGYAAVPSFGSAARGRYGQVGPKGKGGLTLTGELGYEVAWLPDENRSMILGADGPQLIDLPGNAVVWSHEQSKKIVKQKAIPAGSHYNPTSMTSTGGWDFSGGSTPNNDAGGTAKVVKGAANDAKKAVTTAAVKVGKVSVWWENIARTTEGVQRKADKAYSLFEKYTKKIWATLKTTGTKGKGNDYIKNMSRVIGKNQAQYNKASKQLKNLDKSTKKYDIKYKKGNKEVPGKVTLGKYIKYDKESDSYIIDQKQINKVAKSKKLGGKNKAEAIKAKAEEKINDKLSKRNKAEDGIRKAQEALDKFGEELYKTFFAWENELTKIWNITQKITQAESNISRIKAIQETLDKQLVTGLAEANNAFKEESLNDFTLEVQESLEKISKYQDLITEQKEVVNKALSVTDEINTLKAVQKRLDSGKLNATQEVGYKEYRKNLKKRIAAQSRAQKYLDVITNADGTLKIDFDGSKFEKDREAGLYTEDAAKAIQDYVKELVDSSEELNKDYTDLNNEVNNMYDSLSSLQDAWAGYANELWDISEAETKKEVDNLKKLSDSISNSLKNLLDEVKNKLDERRKREDNAKTERDITQKQQRLAALRADTSGGHQVEIAQLEKEIADAQQDYQRTLEDQLLDKLQQQADLAEKQRERQIELQELIASEINNAEQVDKWMAILSNPEATDADKDAAIQEMWEAFKTANDYDKKPQALQESLEHQFNSMVGGIMTNQKKQEELKTAIETLNGTIQAIKKSIEDMQKITSSKSYEQLKGLGFNNSQIRNAGIGIQEFLDNGITKAKDLHSIGFKVEDLLGTGKFTDEQIRKAGYTAAEFKAGTKTKGVNGAKRADKAGYSDKAIASAYGAEAALKVGISGKTVQSAKGTSAKTMQKIVNQSKKDKATQSDLAGIKAGTVDINGKDKGGKLTNSHISEGGYRVGANSGSTLYHAAWDTKKGAPKGDWTEVPIDKLTTKLVKNYPVDARQALEYAIKHKKPGDKINANMKALVKAAGIVGKTYKLSNGYNASLGASGQIHYNGTKDKKQGVHIWDPIKGELSFREYNKDKFIKWASDPNVGREYKTVLKKKGVKGYATGGLADFTGPAWLDGTPSKPELVLSAKDTQNFIALKDVLANAMSGMGDTSNTYGDTLYEININVDKIEKDYDVDRVVKKVKEEITKGAGYRNVTQVRNFR